jgi:uncharacterized phage-associated protein
VLRSPGAVEPPVNRAPAQAVDPPGASGLATAQLASVQLRTTPLDILPLCLHLAFVSSWNTIRSRWAIRSPLHHQHWSEEIDMHDARVIANAVLEKAWELGYAVTQIDIQKICYFLHGHHLRDHGKPLIRTEFEAWQYGPVQPQLYQSFKRFESFPITELATAFDPVRRCEKPLGQIEENSARDTIETYLPLYLEFESFELVDMTHAPGTPWSRTLASAHARVNIGMRISDEVIHGHFEGVARVEGGQLESAHEEGCWPS